MTVHSALMSCLPPATFSRSASLSSPSGAAYGTTTWTVSAVSATALTLTLPRLVLSCFSMMPFGSLSSASRYFGFSAANLPTRSCTSPRVIACDIVVSLLVAVRCCGCRCSRAARRASGEALYEASKAQRLKGSKLRSFEGWKARGPRPETRPRSLAALQPCSLAVLQPRLEVDLRDGVAQARAHDGALGLDVLLAAGDLLEI